MHALISELRRRNVLRAAAFYTAAGWLLVQVATQVFPFFEIPNWVVRLVVLAIVLGFAPAMAFAWLYELTPQGLRRESEVARAQSIAPQTGRKLDRLIIAVLGLAVVLLLADKLVLHKAAAPAAPAAEAGDKSVAVLPFANLSDDKANAYFAEGIQDEILTRLAKIGALKVISRTSTQHYASSPDNLPEIARQLGVANILEGSVQKAGDAVHINVQLIRAAGDDHLWAESYDRKLDNIFGVEGEVAGAIAEALNARLSGAEQQVLAQKPTDNPAAYDAYLRAVALQGQGNNYPQQRRAAAAYAEAVRLDPRFALAWARLAVDQSYLYFNDVEPGVYTAEAVRQAADTALRLQPELGEAQLAQGFYRYRVLRDYAGAQEIFAQAARRLPNDAEVWAAIGLVERRQGKWDQALAHLEQAAELDPRDAGLLGSIGAELMQYLNRFEEERAWLNRALALVPQESFALGAMAYSYESEGRLEEAAAVIERMPPDAEDSGAAATRSYQHLLEHRYDAAIAELQPALARPPDDLNGLGPSLAVNLATAQLAAGQGAQARATAERLIAQIEPQASGRVDESGLPIALAQAYAFAGQQQAALKQAQHAIELYRNDAIHLPQAQAVLAQVQAMAGDHGAAIAGLEHLLTVPNGLTPALLRLDPSWDPLRGDPAFQKLTADSRLVTFGPSKP